MQLNAFNGYAPGMDIPAFGSGRTFAFIKGWIKKNNFPFNPIEEGYLVCALKAQIYDDVDNPDYYRVVYISTCSLGE